ncbi:ABC transporter family substrate-binding protein [Nocardia cyriacigeorgica]|uniref:ABC transporter family substrate-binding protein n=1 Tax=Nocardia cyriacigeorgica TaxID=135487 RepID=UPI00189371BA|nr:ABC transporter family substrate-binding protein [Nocardia cyriacigeorgica]MBF6162825.1 ABC transporter family substrate-binding protein [Nocardia cyriacigeorgica]MBF6201875.1 ABC transporter family substrate-binding protein [Nocardia cyriacigeorgica]MBF6343027.1 ABC transporter family substrate-binding protein [Nocardia cyriacigeorgica]MBF6515702.1 ABC transporter family substrate-binding protein [Nocardia cyriacigeorgica]
MRIRSMGTRLVIPIAAFGLIMAGCSADNAAEGGDVNIGTSNQINARDRSELRDGGNLRLSISSLPATFNVWHVDSDADASEVVGWTMPSAFQSDAAGKLSVDHNYFTSIELTNTDPQQVTYTINPKAVWSDGSPITWEDMAAQAHALSGRNPDFQIAASVGFDRVERVERGIDDRQAIVTFNKHYAEWQGQYGILLPKQAMATPQAFNDFYRNDMPLSAGPFMITAIDRGQNRITLSRNPLWWGDTPKLDTVTYSALDIPARIAAVQNNEVDSVDISGIEEVTTARNTPGVQVLRTPLPRFSHFTFNGAPGSILEDPALRRAIAKGIDRQAIASATQLGVVDDPKPLNNHIYMQGQEGYQDNAGVIAYNPEQAAKELDELGWKLNGDVREKDGRQLVIRDVMYQQDLWVQTAQIAQQNLAAIGVKLVIETYPGQGLFTDVIDPGNFDIAQFSWVGSILPLGALPQIYAYDPAQPRSNKGRIGSPELNDLIERTISELDPKKAIELANEADKMIFELVHSLPITQSPGTVAQRLEVANWGAFGLASPDYTNVGFLK